MHASNKLLNPSKNKTRIPPSDPKLIAAMKSGIKLYIFPSTSSNPTEDAQHVIPRSTTISTIALFPTEGPTIRVHFDGPEAPYRYEYDLPPIGPSIPPRIAASVASHLRRIKSNEVDRLSLSASFEGTQIDLCYVDFGLDMNADITRGDFGLTLQGLAPLAHKPGARNHSVTQWEIVCRRCGAVVKHCHTDKFWNGRYLAHRKDPKCKKLALPAESADEPRDSVSRKNHRGKR